MTMISYKTMWQEATQEAERLKAEVNRLTALIDAGPDVILRELERTRLIVDLAGIARHMRVERYTPQQWRQRDYLPPVDFPDIKEPLWYVSTLKTHFVEPTGRVWYDHAEELSPAA
jgi:hypothetical protein